MKAASFIPVIITFLAILEHNPALAAPIPVGVDNFIRAESDLYFSNMVKEGSFGKFVHRREPASIDNQTVIRLNRDTLYSFAVFDLDAGPVTVTLPDSGGRFMSLMVVSQDHFVPMVSYKAGPHVIDRKMIGTRYVLAGVRTLVDPADADDVAKVHALQDGIRASFPAGGKFEVPEWDPASQKKVRDALLVLASTVTGFSHAFGTTGEVDPVKHLIGTAAGWGGNPDKDATYLSFSPPGNDGNTAYRLVVKDVPVDAFWSVSLYNAGGYFVKNPQDAYSINGITGKKSEDGSVTIHFGGADTKATNYLPIMPGWNYTVRLYRPRAEILDGSWKFPEPQPVE